MGDELTDLLGRNPAFDKLFICVAFVKRSGVILLRPALDDFVRGGGVVEVVAGIDHRGTSKQGLEELSQVTQDVYIFHDNVQDRTFHPKLYLFEKGTEAVGFLGSSNLTAGGLYSNYELNVRYDLNLTVAADADQYAGLQAAYQQARKEAHLLTPALLIDMESRNWLGDESTAFRTTPVAAVSGTTMPPSLSPFPRISIPTPPRRPRPPASSTLHRTSTLLPTTLTAPSIVRPTGTFVMTLQRTDITRGGRSPDVWIPLEAVNANPVFWQWPGRYNPVTGLRGSFSECYFRTKINDPGGSSLVDVRFYSYQERHEFRINTDKIRSQASVGDLMLIDRVSAGLGYEYEITVVLQADPAHASLLAQTQQVQARNSQKRYAYI